MLDRSWQSKVTSISKTKNLTTLTTTTLFGKPGEIEHIKRVGKWRKKG